jgi:hypothetical protein
MKALMMLVVALTVPLAAQPRRAPSPPVTAQGRPQLEGVWNFSTLTPLERPAQFANQPTLSDAEADAFVRDTLVRNNRDRRDGGAQADVGRAVNDAWFDRGTSLARVNGRIPTSLIVDPPDGRLPALTPAARDRQAAAAADTRQHPADGPENRSLQERCLAFNAGPPILPGPYNNFLHIMQFPDYVVLFTEMIHDARMVPLNSTLSTPSTLVRWMGQPGGRYEGGTLVVESRNFNGRNDVRGSDAGLHLVERFTRADADTLLYEFTVNNPTAFTKPWTALLPMKRSSERLFEYACHEGNYALPDILRGARVQE